MITMPDDDEIRRCLEAARASGELQAAPSWGRPLAQIEGWDETPPELRMPFKVLKDAGYRPAEVTLFHERAALRAAVSAEPDAARREQLQRQLVDLENKLALRLEALRMRGAL